MKQILTDFLYLDLNTCERCMAIGETLKKAIDVLSGVFTEQGYIVPDGEEWKLVNKIPQEYRILPKFETPEIDFDAIATRKPAGAVKDVKMFVELDTEKSVGARLLESRADYGNAAAKRYTAYCGK